MKRFFIILFLVLFVFSSASFANPRPSGKKGLYFPSYFTGNVDKALDYLEIVATGDRNQWDLSHGDRADVTYIDGATRISATYVFDETLTNETSSEDLVKQYIRPNDYDVNGPGVWYLLSSTSTLLNSSGGTMTGPLDLGDNDIDNIGNVDATTMTVGGTTTGYGVVKTEFVVAASDSPVWSRFQADYLCDGTDDDVQINAALAAFPAVTLMPGTYNTTADIDLPPNAILKGAVAPFQRLGVSGDNSVKIVPGTGVVNVISVKDSRGFQIHNLQIPFGSAPTTCTGIYIEASWDWQISNIVMSGLSTANHIGVHVNEGANGPFWGQIDNVYVTDSGGHQAGLSTGFYFTGEARNSQTINVTSLYHCMANDTNYGFRFNYAANPTLYDCQAEGCRTDGVYVPADTWKGNGLVTLIGGEYTHAGNYNLNGRMNALLVNANNGVVGDCSDEVFWFKPSGMSTLNPDADNPVWRLYNYPMQLDGGLILGQETAEITAATDTIPANKSVVRTTPDDHYTLTSTPSIADPGNDKKLLLIYSNVGSASVTLQDDSVLSGSGIRLFNRDTITIGYEDAVLFRWDEFEGLWRQITHTPNEVQVNLEAILTGTGSSGEVGFPGDVTVTDKITGGIFNIPLSEALTIDDTTEAITITGGYHRVDTYGDAASDDLKTINGGSQGDILILSPQSGARDVVIKNDTGNIKCVSDFTMDNYYDRIVLQSTGTNWIMISKVDADGDGYFKGDVDVVNDFTAGTITIGSMNVADSITDNETNIGYLYTMMPYGVRWNSSLDTYDIGRVVNQEFTEMDVSDFAVQQAMRRVILEDDGDVAYYLDSELSYNRQGVAPTITGTDDAGTANKLSDNGVFTSAESEYLGKYVHNTTDDTYAMITAKDSDNVLSIASDIMDSGEAFEICTAVLNGDDGQVMVEIPQFHYIQYYNEDCCDDHYYLVSLTPFTLIDDSDQTIYSRVHPAFYVAGSKYPAEYIYVGAYEGAMYDDTAGAIADNANTDLYASGDKLMSVSGYYPKTNETRAEFRAMAEERGSNWHLMDAYTWSALALLYISEEGDFDSQAAIGDGRTGMSGGSWTEGSYHALAGLSNVIGNATGNSDQSFMSFRGVEGFFGHIDEFIDGCNVNNDGSSSKLYVSSDYEDFADNTASNYIYIGDLSEENANYISEFIIGYALFFPSETNGSNSTMVPDTYKTQYPTNNSSGWHVIKVGGTSSDGLAAGVFRMDSNESSSYDGGVAGSRLVYKP
jgi:DNA/RNA endonuclease YhcR with UshA esterase domain